MNLQFSWEKYPSMKEDISSEEVARSAEEFIKKRERAIVQERKSGFEDVSPARVIDAVRDNGERERQLEVLNPLFERNIAGIRFAQHLTDFLYVHGAKPEERSKIADLWKIIREKVKKLPLEERDGYIHGVQGMATTLSLLRHLGYDARYARPVEDGLMATDFIARHKKFPNVFLLIQVESPGTPDFYADAQTPWFSGRESNDTVLKRMQKARKIKTYAQALSEKYAEQFSPVILSVPRFETNSEIDPVTGRPSARLLDKYSKNDILEKAAVKRR